MAAAGAAPWPGGASHPLRRQCSHWTLRVLWPRESARRRLRSSLWLRAVVVHGSMAVREVQPMAARPMAAGACGGLTQTAGLQPENLPLGDPGTSCTGAAGWPQCESTLGGLWPRLGVVRCGGVGVTKHKRRLRRNLSRGGTPSGFFGRARVHKKDGPLPSRGRATPRAHKRKTAPPTHARVSLCRG